MIDCMKPSWRQFSAFLITINNQQLIHISMKPGNARSKCDMFLCIHTASNSRLMPRPLWPEKTWLEKLNHLGSFVLLCVKPVADYSFSELRWHEQGICRSVQHSSCQRCEHEAFHQRNEPLIFPSSPLASFSSCLSIVLVRVCYCKAGLF